MNPQRTYFANAAHPGAKETLETGQMWLTPQAAHFRGKSGEFALPMDELQVTRGGPTGDTIRMTHPDFSGYFISTTDLAVIDDPVLAGRSGLRKRLMSRKGRSACCLGCIVVLALLAVGIIIAMAAGKDVAIRGTAHAIPQDWEKQLGNQILSLTIPTVAAEDNADALATLQEIAEPIFRAIPPDEGFSSLTIHLSPDPTPNAFALPGGHIVINAGLIDMADTPEEVAGVIAHEAGHAVHRHGMQSLLSRAGTAAIISLVIGDMDGLGSILIDGGGFLLNQKYSRNFEREADDKAWQYMTTAQVNPAGLATFFEKLQELQGSATPPAILSTHPNTDERLQTIQTKLDALPSGSTWHVYTLDFDAFKKQVKSGAEKP